MPPPLRSPDVKVAASDDDWCRIATLPSSLVICADAELRAITSERNSIYKAIKARLDYNHRRLLDENQRNWIKTYATTCGVTPEMPPPLPPSPAVRACFKRAGLARNEFLRGYLSDDQPRQVETSGLPSEEIPLQSDGGVEMVP